MENYRAGAGRERLMVMSESFSVERVSEFRKEVNERIANGEVNFLLDFSRCTFIDSTGLGVLVAVYKKCAEIGGDLKLKGLSGPVLKVFTLTRLDRVFTILP